MENRRKYPRHHLPLCVHAVSDDGPEETMSLLNISAGGACLGARRRVPIGESLNLEIVDCDSGFVTPQGSWSRIHGDLVQIAVRATVLRDRETLGEEHNHHLGVQFHALIDLGL